MKKTADLMPGVDFLNKKEVQIYKLKNGNCEIKMQKHTD